MSSRATFEGLPTELRLEILKHALPEPDLLLGFKCTDLDPTRREDAMDQASLVEPFNQLSSTSPRASSKGSSGLNVLLTSERVHSEAVEILYSRTKFRFWDASAFFEFLDSIDDYNTTLIRHIFLRVDLTPNHPDEALFRLDLQNHFKKAADTLLSLRNLQLELQLDPLHCLGDHTRQSRQPRQHQEGGSLQLISLNELFSPLTSITTLRRLDVNVEVQPFPKPGTDPLLEARVLKAKKQLQESLSMRQGQNQSQLLQNTSMELDADYNDADDEGTPSMEGIITETDAHEQD